MTDFHDDQGEFGEDENTLNFEERAFQRTSGNISRFSGHLMHGLSEEELQELAAEFDSLSPKNDLRLVRETRKAILGLNDYLRYPTADASYKDVSIWWLTEGASLTEILGVWSGTYTPEMDSLVFKIDEKCDHVPVRIFSPAMVPNTDLPVIVYMHGGGFGSGSFKDRAYDNYLTRLAALGKCLIVAVDYRLSPDHPYPCGLEDCYTVTKWVVEGNAKGVPSGKVVLAGDSTGANLAFGTALMAKKQEQDLVDGLYFICPMFYGEGKKEELPSTLEFDGYFLCEGYLHAIANGVTDDKEQWFFNPMLWPFLADPEDLRCLPRCRTIVMQCDIARDMGMAMHERIRAVRVPSSCSMVAGAVHQQHLFTKHSPEITDESIHDLARFATFVKQNADAK